MKYRLFFATVMAAAVTIISTSGIMAQNSSKEQRKPAVDTSRKPVARPATPAKPMPKADTTKKAGGKHKSY
ncbi:hypothetical protein ACTJJ0_05930 [Chitinophaga sp. 22321]|uniref:Uncharacterized protein n=1 Tax=Chitinophaga hostae TaxID=2831022 RepID=A0ABS5IZ13_9BACT|nr:hypothetical protein [Chitinophaga hostae]MBS0028203.1 hypothetical protein [Chitinophaga hostae]